MRIETAGMVMFTDPNFPLTGFRKQGPCFISTKGDVLFCQTGGHSYNRVSGPSTILASGRVSYTNKYGQFSRTDGPAIVHPDGSKDYRINNIPIDPSEYFIMYGAV